MVLLNEPELSNLNQRRKNKIAKNFSAKYYCSWRTSSTNLFIITYSFLQFIDITY